VSADATDPEPEAAAPRPCSPCRATGSVISNLGGAPSTIACPWCGGSGVFDPERDAQAAAAEARGGDAAAGG
jgi:DnaJ-class molecular chaperone